MRSSTLPDQDGSVRGSQPDLPSVGWVVLSTPDLNGVLRGKALSAADFASALERGLPMTDLFLAQDAADEPIATIAGIGVRTGSPDLLLHPDPNSLVALPWRPTWAWCLATPLWADGSLCELAPRAVLESVVARLGASGLSSYAAFEFEFRLRHQHSAAPATAFRSYDAAELGRLEEFVDDLTAACSACGLTLSGFHTEAGPGLVEVAMAPASGVKAADDAIRLRACVAAVARQHGLLATFLAKPVAGQEGSGGHVHVSLAGADRENVFAADLRKGEEPTAAMMAAVAGVLEHMRTLSLLYNPGINAYKRLVPGFFAPVTASWGVDNRTVAVRIVPGHNRESAHLEVRRAGADANPYLVLAAVLASALDGIERELHPPALVTGDATEACDAAQALPSSLEQALIAFRGGQTAGRLLGNAFAEHFALTREWELRAWQHTVTDWECRRVEGPEGWVSL